jgi:hypothetical protein
VSKSREARHPPIRCGPGFFTAPSRTDLHRLLVLGGHGRRMVLMLSLCVSTAAPCFFPIFSPFACQPQGHEIHVRIRARHHCHHRRGCRRPHPAHGVGSRVRVEAHPLHRRRQSTAPASTWPPASSNLPNLEAYASRRPSTIRSGDHRDSVPGHKRAPAQKHLRPALKGKGVVA